MLIFQGVTQKKLGEFAEDCGGMKGQDCHCGRSRKDTPSVHEQMKLHFHVALVCYLNFAPTSGYKIIFSKEKGKFSCNQDQVNG